jgi:hypothetical protein
MDLLELFSATDAAKAAVDRKRHADARRLSAASAG